MISIAAKLPCWHIQHFKGGVLWNLRRGEEKQFIVTRLGENKLDTRSEQRQFSYVVNQLFDLTWS